MVHPEAPFVFSTLHHPAFNLYLHGSRQLGAPMQSAVMVVGTPSIVGVLAPSTGWSFDDDHITYDASFADAVRRADRIARSEALR